MAQSKCSVEEKKKILYCFAYSRYEKWGRQKKQVFEEKIREAELPAEKIQATTTAKLMSIVSQLSVYIPEDEIERINQEALNAAISEYQQIGQNKQQEYERSHWKIEEKWTLLWAMEYAKEKCANQKERCQEWQRIFKHLCPSKEGIPKGKLTTQKSNFLAQKVFTEDEIENMKTKVKTLVSNKICPLSEPPELPRFNTASQSQETLRASSPERTNHQSTITRNRRSNSQNYQVPRNRPAPPEPPDSPSSNSSSDSDEPERPHRRNTPPPRPPNVGRMEIEAEQRELEEELSNKIEETRNMSMEDRPKLIKLRENKKFKELLKKVNIALRRLIPTNISLTEINYVNYGAAWYIQSKMAPEHVMKKGKDTRTRRTEPPWKVKMMKKIERLRAEISQISSFTDSQNPTMSLQRKINNLKIRYNISNEQLSAKRAENQAIVKALAGEIRNKEKKIKQKQINKQFAENPRIVYRHIIGDSIKVETPPSKEEIERFWKPLYEDR